MAILDLSKLNPALLGYDPSHDGMSLPPGLIGGASDPQLAALLGGPQSAAGANVMPSPDVLPHDISSPPAPVTPSTPDVGQSPSDTSGPAPQGAASGFPALPPIPQYNKGGEVGNVLDSVLLGGALRKNRERGFQADVANYQQVLSRLALQRDMSLAATAGANGDDQAAANADPQGYEKIRLDRMTPANLKADESRFLGNSTLGATGSGGFITAPKITTDNGRVGVVANGAYKELGTTGPVVKYSADGQGYDERGIDPASKFPALPVYKTFAPADGHGWTSPGAAPPTGSAPATGATGSSALTAMTTNGRLNPVSFFKGFVGPQEGGYNPSDMNGSPTNHGINQAANPGVDVKNLSADGAADIFAKKYFAQSGAANLPPALAAVHADTSFINPSKAKSLLAQSGGDAAKYLQLREQWMQGMVANNPAAAKYGKAWANRNAGLAALINGSDATAPTASASNDGLAPGRTPSAPYQVPNTDDIVQTGTDGLTHSVGKSAWGAEQALGLRKTVLDHEDYKQATAAQTALSAMTANSGKMTGPSAYAMLDTFARAINPGAVARPQVIETIEKNLGPINRANGGVQGLLGMGNLPQGVRQQIVDAVTPFVQSHWDAANALNQSNVDIAKRHNMNAADVTAPLGARPTRFTVAPDKSAPAVGAVEKGYRFNGGDPRQPTSWQKVQ